MLDKKMLRTLNCVYLETHFRDTERMGQIFDWDGSITGMPKSTIVRDQPFYTSDSCVSKPQWGMSACPHTYVSAEDSNSGYEGTISKY